MAVKDYSAVRVVNGQGHDEQANAFWMKKKKFAAASSSISYVSQLRRVAIGLAIIVVALSGMLLYYIPKDEAVTNIVNPSPLAVAPTIQDTNVASADLMDVLVAKNRIEQGSRITEKMLMVEKMNVSTLPIGALVPQDINAVVGKFANALIEPNSPITRSEVSDIQPMNAFHIPAGYRAVTITIDSRSGVEGFARPNSRVDVLWVYNDDSGRRNITTIVPFAKILSVGGATANAVDQNGTQQAGITTATLLVTKREAKVIELARNEGAISLSLVGDEEMVKLTSDDLDTNIDVREIMKRSTDGIAKNFDGKMETYDPRTGKVTRFVLDKNRWMVETDAATGDRIPVTN